MLSARIFVEGKRELPLIERRIVQNEKCINQPIGQSEGKAVTDDHQIICTSVSCEVNFEKMFRTRRMDRGEGLLIDLSQTTRS